MKNNDTKKDLDNFWAELIDKSEWAKNEVKKNPGEFKNLNILGVKKNINNHISYENKVEVPKKVILTEHKKSFLLPILLIILLVIIYFSSIYYFCLKGGSSCADGLSLKNYFAFYYKVFLSIINTIKNI